MQTKKINRKQFINCAACMAGAMMLPASSFADEIIPEGTLAVKPLKGYTPAVSAAWIKRDEHKNSYNLFKKMAESATDFRWLSKGDPVFLKLALNSGNEYPATTDPWALHCMITLLKEKGAGRIIAGDQSGIETVHWTKDKKKGSSRECCQSAGLLKVINDNNIEDCFFEERGYDAYLESVPAGSHNWPGPVMITDMLKEVDHIIYMARVSSHVMGDITSGLKLSVGFLREDSRVIFHQGGDKFNAMYDEINDLPEIKDRLRLIVSSGRRVLSNIGPDFGHITKPETGMIFASDDLLAHEAMAYAWLQWNREFETSWLSNATSGNITNLRTIINKGFVYWMWDSGSRADNTPGLPEFRPGNIYNHPSIVNRAKRSGGYPEKINLIEVNKERDEKTVKYINDILRI